MVVKKIKQFELHFILAPFAYKKYLKNWVIGKGEAEVGRKKEKIEMETKSTGI
jgi:hypothetical protein